MNWYYALNGQQTGPVTEAEIARLATSGTITGNSLVWQEGMPDWKPLSLAMPGLGDAPQLGGVSVPAAQKDLYVQQLREGVVSTAPGVMVYAGF